MIIIFSKAIVTMTRTRTARERGQATMVKASTPGKTSAKKKRFKGGLGLLAMQLTNKNYVFIYM